MDEQDGQDWRVICGGSATSLTLRAMTRGRFDRLRTKGGSPSHQPSPIKGEEAESNMDEQDGQDWGVICGGSATSLTLRAMTRGVRGFPLSPE